MKKILNKKGFAMVETLIAAVSVISIFSLLYNLVYPLLGGYKKSQNYDDLDSKYIAFYIKEMIETDKLDISKQLSNLPDESECNGTCRIYETYAYLSDESGENRVDLDHIDINSKGESKHYYIGNELCDILLTENDIKNNPLLCKQFIENTNIKNIYLINYETTAFKRFVENSTLRRSLKEYVKYMPTHVNAKEEKKNNYYRIIVEIEHESYNTSKNEYYTYASIEVKK